MDRLLELTHRAEQSHFWFRGFRSFVRPVLARAVRGRVRPRILDCGCGTGANLEWLAGAGRAAGFDLTWNGLEFARALGRPPVARASIGSIPVASGRVDVVTSFDVFQCLPDPVEHDAIREMFRVLAPGGHLVMTVAALELLYGRHSALSEEVRRYTPRRLRALVEGAGFVVERLTFTHASIFPLTLATRTVQRWASNGAVEAGEYEIAPPAAPVNGILAAVLGLEARALRFVNMPIGSSLLCLARKPPADEPR